MPAAGVDAPPRRALGTLFDDPTDRGQAPAEPWGRSERDHPDGGRLTLEQRLNGVWEGLNAGGEARCLVCRGPMEWAGGARRCGGCRSRLS